MQKVQYDRQKLYYRWALILCIIALTGYIFYFEYERYTEGVKIFENNISLYIRFALILYFSILIFFIPKIPEKVFNILGFLIMIPLGWAVSIISFLTIGYEGITVTGFIFLIIASAVVFDFTVLYFSIALFLILSFHFILLSFYRESQPEGLYTHIFLLSLSGILGLTINFLVNIIKKNEALVLQEREMLLKEIHHRVKNNLQVISSLLDLQSGSITDENTKALVKEGQSRVKSIALIHQLLYQTDNYTSINFEKYLEQLMAFLHNTFNRPENKIKYFINAVNVQLDIDTAIPLALITNELATNAYKYAFKSNMDGRIVIELNKINEVFYELRFSDNGNGLPEKFNLEKNNSLGLKLVKILTKQLAGKLNINRNGGTSFIIKFQNMIK